MRIISRSRLRLFWSTVAGRSAEGPLKAWFAHVSSRSITWRNWTDVKSSFSSASVVGSCVVFNIGGNKFRLVTRIMYGSHRVYILRVMTHAEYDRTAWKEECGCFSDAPAARLERRGH